MLTNLPKSSELTPAEKTSLAKALREVAEAIDRVWSAEQVIEARIGGDINFPHAGEFATGLAIRVGKNGKLDVSDAEILARFFDEREGD